jgi:asparagine synthase (glutamine-hydrolysing)
MCGITGFTGEANAELLKAMTDMIRHRGPDADGYYVVDGVNMGSRRLRIIDLSGGDQPIANEDQTIWIVYNGEIYNDPELRASLEKKGHVYRTRCDTETLLHLYEEYGETFAEHLNGIFVFAIWDSRKRQLLIGRDQFGIKPLHYTTLNGQLLFGSEVKAILRYPGVERCLDHAALHLFLNLRYIPGDQTLFEGIQRLPPGHALAWKDGQTHLIRYWNPVYEVDHVHDEDYFAEGIRHHLREAVRRQLVSDVPLGLYLSGGMDSSSITAFASELRGEPVDTFSLGFNEPTDELDDAAFVSAHYGTRHHASTVHPEPLQMFPEVIWYAEEPKENILQGFLLARHARQYVTVALSGLGGDELFAGYQIYRFIKNGEALHHLIPSAINRGLLSPLSHLLYNAQNATGTLGLDHYRRGAQLMLAGGDPARYYSILRNTWDADAGQFANVYGPMMREKAFRPVRDSFAPYFNGHGKGKTFLEQTLDAEFHTKMVEDFLNNEDRVSMGNSLEVRVPFLDPDLVKFAFSIPGSLKYKDGEGKYIFKKAMRGILPEQTLRKEKWGFTFSSYHQFTKDLKTAAERILTRERVESQGLFNYDYLRRIIDHAPSPRLYWHYFFLWNVVGVTIWQQMFLERDVAAPEFSLEAYS